MSFVIKRAIYSLISKLNIKNLIIDPTGVILTPGNGGKDCKGNGEHTNWLGKPIECCCDECGFYLLCLDHDESPF